MKLKQFAAEARSLDVTSMNDLTETKRLTLAATLVFAQMGWALDDGEEGAGEEAAPSLNLSFVGEPWWPLVMPDTKPQGEPTHISRRWFELCAITEVMRELKSGDLCIPGSDRYSDFREQFVSEEECLQNLASYGSALACPLSRRPLSPPC